MPDIFYGAGDRTAKLVQQGAARVTMEEFKQHRPHSNTIPQSDYVMKCCTVHWGVTKRSPTCPPSTPATCRYFRCCCTARVSIRCISTSGEWTFSEAGYRGSGPVDLGFEQSPTTIDGMSEVFAAFKEAYPNKYPHTGSGMTFSRSFSEVFYAHGAAPLPCSMPTAPSGTSTTTRMARSCTARCCRKPKPHWRCCGTGTHADTSTPSSTGRRKGYHGDTSTPSGSPTMPRRRLEHSRRDKPYWTTGWASAGSTWVSRTPSGKSPATAAKAGTFEEGKPY